MKRMTKNLGILALAFLFITGCKKETTVSNADNLNPPTADAGNAQTLQAPAGAATLSGTGTTENGHITGYLWSLISGPNLPDILTPSAATTVIHNLVAGTYLFQFAVIDEAGLTGIDTVSLQVLPSVEHTLTLQPANNPWEYTFYGNSSQDYGSGPADQLCAAAWTSSNSPVFVRGAIHFDFSSIPAGSTILSAKLSLYSPAAPHAGDLVHDNSGTGNSFYIRQVATNWTPAGSTWQTQPSLLTANQVLVPHTDLPSLDLVDMDVTGLVASMQASNNYGFMILLQNETPYNIRQFSSSGDADASKHPKLVITYQ